MNEDPKFFIDGVKTITQVMHVTKEENVELVFYQLEDVSYEWVTIWKEVRGYNATPVSWNLFQIDLLDRFFPREMTEANIKKFMKMR